MKALIATCVFAACFGAALGVKCYVSPHTSYGIAKSNNCGDSSNKCVTSRQNDTVTKMCYSSKTSLPQGIPEGDVPSDGCKSFVVQGVQYEICVCTGDECNGSMKVSVITTLVFLVSAVAGYLMM